MKKIIILSRVSTMQQSLESQTKELISHALKLGYSKEQQIIIEDVESGIKLSEEERKGLQKLKTYINTDKDIDCVICWEPSRLSRQQKTLYSIRDFLVERKIQLYILNPYMRLLNDERTQIEPTANITFSIFSTIAENEMMLKKERFMRAKNELTKQGKKAAGAVIFGYMKDKNKNCVPHPINSTIIIDLFRHYIEDRNASLYETYQYAMSKYPETFPLLPYIKAQHKIRNFFANHIYYEGNWCYPPIITEEMWIKTKEKMEKARCKPRHKSKRNLMCRGMLYCKHCGKMMTPSGGNTKAYICPTDKKHRLQINFDVADWIIWEETRSIVNMNASLDSNTKTTELKEQIRMKNNEIDHLSKEITKIEEKEGKIIDLYVEDKITKDIFDKRLDNMKTEKELHTIRRDKAITERNELNNILESIQKNLLNIKTINVDSITTFENRLEYVRKYIDKAIVSREERFIIIEFYYKNHSIISQHGVYKYRNMGGVKHIYRINSDNTEDLIYKER